SRERVIAAIRNTGLEFPLKRITVNLAPADRRKEGSAFDLPIALGILTASGQLPREALSRYLVLGELSLDGVLRPLRGAMALAQAAGAPVPDAMLLPAPSAPEAALHQSVQAFGVATLAEAVAVLTGAHTPRAATPPPPLAGCNGDVDLREVRGQSH